jgi:hypothetical protein
MSYCQNRFYPSLSIATLDSALSIFLSSLRHLLLLPIQVQQCHLNVQDSLIGIPAIYCDYFCNRTICSLRQADHSSRGVLPTVLRRCLWPRKLDNEEAMAHGGGGGAVPPETNKQTNIQTTTGYYQFFRYLHHIYITSLCITVQHVSLFRTTQGHKGLSKSASTLNFRGSIVGNWHQPQCVCEGKRHFTESLISDLTARCWRPSERKWQVSPICRLCRN